MTERVTHLKNADSIFHSDTNEWPGGRDSYAAWLIKNIDEYVRTGKMDNVEDSPEKEFFLNKIAEMALDIPKMSDQEADQVVMKMEAASDDVERLQIITEVLDGNCMLHDKVKECFRKYRPLVESLRSANKA
jgi:hypothetical protein